MQQRISLFITHMVDLVSVLIYVIVGHYTCRGHDAFQGQHH